MVNNPTHNIKEFCGIGTNKIKRRLSILAENNIIAKMYRLAMEIEDANKFAKRSPSPFQEKLFFKRDLLIHELIQIIKNKDIIYGRTNSDISGTNSIVFFELPNCQVIFYHTILNDIVNFPKYEKKYNPSDKNNLYKIEQGILKTFPLIINK